MEDGLAGVTGQIVVPVVEVEWPVENVSVVIQYLAVAVGRVRETTWKLALVTKMCPVSIIKQAY